MQTPIQRPSKRFYELDSLRGVAALTVVFHHFLYLTSPHFKAQLLHSPARVLIAGHEAVVLFFILSGLVLTLPYLKRSSLRYGSFLLKRVCRIYLPYLAALALAVGCDRLVPAYRSSIPWINYTWTSPVTARLILQHVLLLGSYNWEQFNTAFWSLVYEMRVSLIFPFMAFAVLRMRTRWTLLCAGAFSAAFFLLTPLLAKTASLTQPEMAKSLITLHYLAFFIVGSLLARHLDGVTAWYGRLSTAHKVILAIAVVCLYAPLHLPQGERFSVASDLYDWATCAASVGLIVLALQAAPFQRFLNSRMVHHLGTISYSLYLVHGTVLFVLIHTCVDRIPLAAVLVLYLLCTWIVTELFYRWVEQPTMMLGRRLTSPQKPTDISASSLPLPEAPVL